MKYLAILAILAALLVGCGAAPAADIPTAAPAPTVQVAPTDTPEPTPTSTATPTVTRTPEPTAIPESVMRAKNVFLYAGPDKNFPSETYDHADLTPIARRVTDNLHWYHVTFTDTWGQREGWVHFDHSFDPRIDAQLPVDTKEYDLPSRTSNAATPVYGSSGGSTCADGTHSSSTGRGTCSHHGGVK